MSESTHKPSRYTFRRYTFTYFPPKDVCHLIEHLALEWSKQYRGSKSTPLLLDEQICLARRMNLADPKFRFTVYQIEVCPTTGRIHYQGYAEFKQSITITAVKKIFDLPGCHYEAANSDQQHCVKYCTKKETRIAGFWTHGEPSHGPGSRTDLHALYELAFQEANPLEVLRIVGPIAMRNLPLYMRTVDVVQGEDAQANRINQRRRERRIQNAKRLGLPTPPNSDEEEDSTDDEV